MMRIAVKPKTSVKDIHLDPFLGISYRNENALKIAREQITKRSYPRKALADILQNYNRSIGNDSHALAQIDNFRKPDSTCVVTGQQLGLMGGPAYTILKGITCLLAAKAANAVPIFWLATEDHDVDEIDHTYLLDTGGNLQRYHLMLPRGQPIENLQLSHHHIETIRFFLKAVGISENDLPKAGDSYASTMARFMVRLFAGTGMVFLEPHLLRPLAKEFWVREIKESTKMQEALQETTNNLIAAGGTPVLAFDAGINLFLIMEGKRIKVSRQGNNFVAGSTSYNVQQLIEMLDNHPERFSASAASRPILQSTLLPTLAYVAGPTELSYHQQLGGYFQEHQVPMPCMIPRIEASLIPPYAANLLEKCGLQPWMDIPQHWNALMPTMQSDVEAMELEWQRSAMRFFSNDISDEALIRYIRLTERKLVKKVTKSRLHKQHTPYYALHLLRNLLHPHNKPQERVLNWYGFQKYSTNNLIKQCLEVLAWKAEGHQYIYFDSSQ